MAQFKILKGNKENLESATIVDGQVLVTKDTGDIHVDIESGRIQLNANMANILRDVDTNAGKGTTTNVPVYFNEGAPVECTDMLWTGDDSEAAAETIDADTLGGRLPSDYALKTDIPEFDDTLSIENCIADAKVVGDVLATKAMTGYGYDGTPIELHEGLITSDAELETALEAIYSEMGTCETKLVRFQGYPDENDYNWFGILRKSSNNYGSLLAQSAYVEGTLISKTKYNGVWQPLEWVNPPMAVGVEYRTTERFLGSSVYVKVFNCGLVPQGETRITHDISPYHLKVRYFSGCTPFFYGADPGNSEYDTWVSVSSNDIYIYRKAASPTQTYCTIFYIK